MNEFTGINRCKLQKFFTTPKNSLQHFHNSSVRKTGENHMANLKHMNNDMAVSPIVATLVLIVVAVIGAVAVGTIMGTFSSDVSKQASAGNAAEAASTDLIVTGSSTMYPVVYATAYNYTLANPVVKVKVTSSGSGAGLAAVTQKVADIGMMSEPLTSTQQAAYPNVKSFQVGVSGVVVVQRIGGGFADASLADLKTIYDTGVAPAAGSTLHGVTVAFTRSDKSGTADTFARLIGATTDINAAKGFVTAWKGNDGTLAQLKAATTPDTAIAYNDWDYVRNDAAVKQVNYVGFSAITKTDDIKNAWNGLSTATFPKGATRPLNFVTNGEPSTLAKDFISFNQMPDQKTLYNNIGIVHVSELVVA